MDKEPKALEFGDYAMRRMCDRQITDAQVWYCVNHHCKEYPVGSETVWQCQLPDGRNLKIRIRDGSANPIYVVDVFSFK